MFSGTGFLTKKGKPAFIYHIQAGRERFALQLIAGVQSDDPPSPVRPATGALRAGTTEAPFTLAGQPEGKDSESHTQLRAHQ